jgi:hypothetical protein
MLNNFIKSFSVSVKLLLHTRGGIPIINFNFIHSQIIKYLFHVISIIFITISVFCLYYNVVSLLFIHKLIIMIYLYLYINLIIYSTDTYHIIKKGLIHDFYVMKRHLKKDFPIIRLILIVNYLLFILLWIILIGTLMESDYCVFLIRLKLYPIFIIVCFSIFLIELFLKFYIMFFMNDITFYPFLKFCGFCTAGGVICSGLVYTYGSVSPLIIPPNTITGYVHEYVLYGFRFKDESQYLMFRNIKRLDPSFNMDTVFNDPITDRVISDFKLNKA